MFTSLPRSRSNQPSHDDTVHFIPQSSSPTPPTSPVTDQLLVVKVPRPGTPLRPWQTRTAGHTSKQLFMSQALELQATPTFLMPSAPCHQPPFQSLDPQHPQLSWVLSLNQLPALVYLPAPTQHSKESPHAEPQETSKKHRRLGNEVQLVTRFLQAQPCWHVAWR